MGNLDYEGRKNVSEKIAMIYLKKNDGNLVEQFSWYERQHDISDSILFTIYWCNKKNKEIQQENLRRKQRLAAEQMSIRLKNGEKVNAMERLESFRFIPY